MLLAPCYCQSLCPSPSPWVPLIQHTPLLQHSISFRSGPFLIQPHQLRKVQRPSRTSEDAAGEERLHFPATIGLIPSSRLFFKHSICHGVTCHAHFFPPTPPTEPFLFPSSSDAHDPKVANVATSHCRLEKDGGGLLIGVEQETS